MMMVTGALILLVIRGQSTGGSRAVSYQNKNYHTPSNSEGLYQDTRQDNISYSLAKQESNKQGRQERQVDAIVITGGDYEDGNNEHDLNYHQDSNIEAEDYTQRRENEKNQDIKMEDEKKFGVGVGVSQFPQNVIPARNNIKKFNNDKRFGFGVGVSQFGQNVVPARNNKNQLNNDKRFGFGVGVSQFGQNVVPAISNKNKLNNDKRFGFGVGVSQFGQNVVPARNSKNNVDNDKRFGFGVGVSQFGQNVIPARNNKNNLDDDKRFGFGVGISQFGQNVIPERNNKDNLDNDKRIAFGTGVSQFGQNVISSGNLLGLNDNTTNKNGNDDEKKIAAVSSVNSQETLDGDDEDNLSPWQKLQKSQIQKTVEKVNATFLPVQQYFNYSYLTGHNSEEEVYHVGTIGKYFGQFILNLPDLLPKSRSSEFWKYLVETEEKNLQKKLKSRIDAGEPLYTNRNREGGFVYEFIEKNPWWHEQIAFCTQSATERFSPKSLACSLIIDFGLTILIELIFMKDLVICTGLMYLTGDTSLCLALYVSKLVYPNWYSQDTPWMANNVHLD